MNKPLLTISYAGRLSAEDEVALCEGVNAAANRIGAHALVLPSGLQATLTHDPSALHERLDRLALAIESLVAINAALLERLPLPGEDEEPDAEAGIPQPLSRPR